MKQKYLMIVWFVCLSIPLSYMMGSHSLSLKPSKASALKKLVNEKESSNKWTQMHFLGGDCGCSENVYLSLVKRFPDTSLNEEIFIIGTNDLWVKKLKEKGYNVTVGKMDEYKNMYSINAVPQVSIFDENKNLLYSGGYTRKRGTASLVEDQIIVKELREKKNALERPIFGCLNGTINRKNADPFGLKY